MSEEKLTYSSNLPERLSALEASVTNLVGQLNGLRLELEELKKKDAPVAAEASNNYSNLK